MPAASTVVSAALEEYRRTEPSIHAWVEVAPQPPLGKDPLSGIPFGVKDIFETRGLATEYGSPLFAGRKGSGDAHVVAELRKRGAILFGKTQTAAFAYFDPPPTRNPRNTAHTPGGSSSGSAAAVAAGVVPFALGTQTMGSIVRPASFCGIVGFKPTFGTFSMEGVLAFAPSLDTVGWLARNTDVCVQVWQALGYGVPAGTGLRFAVPTGLPETSPEMQAAFDHAIQVLQTAGLRVEPLALPRPYSDLLAAVKMVNDYEGARSHEVLWRRFGNQIGEKLAALVVRGMGTPEPEYRSSLELLAAAAVEIENALETFSALLTPAAPGPAPAGLASTGDPVMNAVWTGVGAPVVCLPMPSRTTLPLGIQMTGRRGNDGHLLKAAAMVEELFARAPR